MGVQEVCFNLLNEVEIWGNYDITSTDTPKTFVKWVRDHMEGVGYEKMLVESNSWEVEWDFRNIRNQLA